MTPARLTTIPLAVGLLFTLSTTADAGAARGGSTRLMEIQYCWSMTEVDPLCPAEIATLYPDKTLVVAGEAGSWSSARGGRQLTLTFVEYPVIYSGSQEASGCYVGNIDSGTGISGVWRGCYVP